MIISYEHLPLIRSKAGSEPIYLKAGTFDMFHEGHRDILEFVQSLGGVSVIGISPDSRVQARKGPSRPIRTQDQRAQDVEASGIADFVFIVPDGLLGLPRSIRRLRPYAFVEHRDDSIGVGLVEPLLRLVGARYVISEIPRVCSTTDIIAGKATSTLVNANSYAS